MFLGPFDFSVDSRLIRASCWSVSALWSDHLQVKVDEKTKKFLEEYTVRKRAHLTKLQLQLGANHDCFREFDEAREDESVRESLNLIMKKKSKAENYREVDLDKIRQEVKYRRLHGLQDPNRVLPFSFVEL